MGVLDEILDGLERAAVYVRDGDISATGYAPDELDRLLIVRRRDGLVLLNYSEAAQHHAEWKPFLRVCRGLVLTEQGELVSFPFHKFFNLGEHHETAPSTVAAWQPLSVAEKVDGVLIQVFSRNGELVFASRHGIWTPAASTAYLLWKSAPSALNILSAIPFPRWTLMMELVHPAAWQPGMVHPGTDQALYLLAVRDLETQTLYPASRFWTQPPDPFRLPDLYSQHRLEDLVQLVRSRKHPDWEGVVLQGQDERGNQLVKLKSPAYLERLSRIRGITPRRILSVYREAGWQGVEGCLSGLEEEVLQYLQVPALLDRIREQEQVVRVQAMRYVSIPRERIQEIPPEWRWVIGYADRPNRFEHALRNIVCRRLQDTGADSA